MTRDWATTPEIVIRYCTCEVEYYTDIAGNIQHLRIVTRDPACRLHGGNPADDLPESL